MAPITRADFERCGIGRAIRTAALVLILAAAAVMTDHLVFVAPGTSATAAPVAASSPAVPPAAVDGFALPESLRPTAADVAAEPPTF